VVSCPAYTNRKAPAPAAEAPAVEAAAEPAPEPVKVEGLPAEPAKEA
jgi:hypothetical protein